MAEIRMESPDASLCPFIKMYFWGYDTNVPRVQRIVPNGEMGLCFYRRGDVSYVAADWVAASQKSCIMGQGMHYNDIIAEGEVEIVGTHFTALGASVLIGGSMHDYYGRVVSVADMGDTGLMTLEERIGEAETPEECFELMDRFFLERLDSVDAGNLNLRRLKRAIAYGQRLRRDVRIEDMAMEACLSKRQFGRIFADTVGMPPKDYLRIMRYRRTLAELKAAKGREPVSRIAWRNGYYDFSHLTSDFIKISGYTPSVLLDLSANDNDDAGWRI